MAKIPAKVEIRIKDALKRFKPVIEQAKARDVGEADTSTLVKDILAELFGFDKYTEITAEYQIKSTYCDLALKVDGKLVQLVEVKAIGLELKEAFIKQAVDYAANQGVEWVILTNAQFWQVYRVNFGKPVTSELLMTLDFLALDPKDGSAIESLYLLSREAQGKSLLDEYHEQRQALSKYCVAAVIVSEPVLGSIRRELKRLSPDVKIETEEIREVIAQDVLKREVLEGEKAADAAKKIARAANRALRAKAEETPLESNSRQPSEGGIPSAPPEPQNPIPAPPLPSP